MGNSVHWYGYVLRRKDGHVLRNSLDFEVKDQREIIRLKGNGGSSWRKKYNGWFEQERCVLPMKVDCWR